MAIVGRGQGPGYGDWRSRLQRRVVLPGLVGVAGGSATAAAFSSPGLPVE